ncbi:MAG: TraR/DksA C4-type zinc finger protein [Chloroflexota bacterium]|nr:TraR/DksA C4-type zinc finger protein [Chloroflexia bacterium]MDQ3168031.1 TraR/DksA C4-type zinc finger protein [Chloroflexota bacterium]MDQ3512572.1 TraR/DksA C4-type zinc finger protein [Chloroflexota bacterium]
MQTDQQQGIRDALVARQEQLQGELDRLTSEMRDLGADQEAERGSVGNHSADDGSDVNEQERILTISNDLNDMLSEVNGAMVRLDEGTYGTCVRCGKPINPERLEAFPWVQHDVECQAIMEREAGLQVQR